MDNKTKKRIIGSVATITRCISYIREIQFKDYNLSRGQYMFLTRVHENPGISQEELSYMLKVDKTTTTKALKKLEEKNLIIRNKSQLDRRKWELYPTDELKELYPKLQENIIETDIKVFESFSDEELEMFLPLIKKLEKNINEEWIRIKQENK